MNRCLFERKPAWNSMLEQICLDIEKDLSVDWLPMAV